MSAEDKIKATVLKILSAQPLTIKTLAKRLRVHRATASRHIQTLIDAEFIKKVPDTYPHEYEQFTQQLALPAHDPFRLLRDLPEHPRPVKKVSPPKVKKPRKRKPKNSNPAPPTMRGVVRLYGSIVSAEYGKPTSLRDIL
jgi:hypothetical protein